MKRFIICAVSLFCVTTINAQDYTPIQEFVEVTGSSEVSVTPDTFFVSITIDESDSKGRLSVADQQKRMLKELRDLEIDVAKQLKLNSLTSTFERRTEAYSAINYTLQLNSKQSLVDVFYVLDKLYISNVYLERTECSELDAAKSSARKAAIQDAKRAANELAEAIDQSIGSCFYIYDMSNDYSAVNYPARTSNYMVAKSASADAATESVAAPLDLKDIKLNYRVKAKFLLNQY